MIKVEEYRAFAAQCREIAKRMANEADRKAMEMLGAAWERIANERETAIKAGKPPPSP